MNGSKGSDRLACVSYTALHQHDRDDDYNLVLDVDCTCKQGWECTNHLYQKLLRQIDDL